MYKIVKKSTLERESQRLATTQKKLDHMVAKYSTEADELQDQITKKYHQIKEQETMLLDQGNRLIALTDSLEAANAEIERLNKLSTEAEANEVLLRLSDDMTSMTPVVRWKEGIEERLYEMGFLRDIDTANSMTIQLTLMTVAYEALSQLIESFEQNVEAD